MATHTQPTPHSWLDSSNFTLQGIFVHPSHLASTSPSSSSSSSSSSSPSYSSDGISDGEVGDKACALESFSPPLAEISLDDGKFAGRPTWYEDGAMDYFSTSFPSPPSPSSSQSNDVFSFHDSPHSSTCSTPTFDSYSMSPQNAALPAPIFQSTFSFNKSSQTSSVRATMSAGPSTPRPSSPSGLSHSLNAPLPQRSGSISMLRSISTPVETQRQLDERIGMLSALEVAVEEHTAKLARAQSEVSLEAMGNTAFPGPSDMSAGMARSSSSIAAFGSVGCWRALPSSFGEGWGNSLPEREVTAPPTVPFPYNLVQPQSPSRIALARSQSAMTVPQISPSLLRRDSSPIISSSESDVYMSAGRARRATFTASLATIDSSK